MGANTVRLYAWRLKTRHMRFLDLAFDLTDTSRLGCQARSDRDTPEIWPRSARDGHCDDARLADVGLATEMPDQPFGGGSRVMMRKTHVSAATQMGTPGFNALVGSRLQP